MSTSEFNKANLNDVLKEVLGEPRKINIPENYDPDCLYQAFVTAITAFHDSNNTSANFKIGVLNMLDTRVAQSRQTHATTCYSAFTRVYATEIADALEKTNSASKNARSALPTSSTNHRPPNKNGGPQ